MKSEKAKFKAYAICSLSSNCMKSLNPDSGIYEAKTARCLDINGGNPFLQSGGVIVLAALEGNGSRPSHRGTDINDGKVMFTLNSVEIHGVVCGKAR